MKFLVLAVCVACAAAAPTDQTAKVLRSDYEQSPEGNFQYVFETENGIAGQASGQIKALGKDETALEVQGSSQYKNPDGEIIQLTYVANENGYVAQGAHLPTPPPTEPLPEHVVRLLAYNAAHPYVEKP